VKIAVVTADWPAFAHGGVATLIRALARGLVQAGVDVEVWTRGGGGRDRLLDREVEPFTVRALPGRSWRRRGASHWARGLPGLLDRFCPDAVVASTWDVLPGVQELLPRLAVFAHGRDLTAALEPRRERLRAEVLAAPARWLCLTRWMEGVLRDRGVRPDLIHCVPAAIDDVPSPACRATVDPCVALQVGRLIPRKGQDLAIEATGRLGGKVLLRLVGEGPDRARLEGLAGPHVRIEGGLDPEALERTWAEASLCVMAAREEDGGDTEGFGLVYLEAGARGLPVIGARSAGTVEAVVDGVTGLQVHGVDELTEAMGRLAGDPALRERLGREGRLRYERGARPIHLARAVIEAVS
jgi:glycosyltransferase involved in cell wall biosynthesis